MMIKTIIIKNIYNFLQVYIKFLNKLQKKLSLIITNNYLKINNKVNNLLLWKKQL